jgi:hypothetical protein
MSFIATGAPYTSRLICFHGHRLARTAGRLLLFSMSHPEPIPGAL